MHTTVRRAELRLPALPVQPIHRHVPHRQDAEGGVSRDRYLDEANGTELWMVPPDVR